jgi:hypothetical protein
MAGGDVEGFMKFDGPQIMAAQSHVFGTVMQFQTNACASAQCVSTGKGNDGSNCCGHF